METRQILKVKDLKRIKKVHFTNPELMAEDAEETIKSLYLGIQEIENEIHSYRDKIRELENTLQDKKGKYQRFAPLFDIEFETTEKEYITNTSSIGIMGLGNDTLGSSSMI